MIYALNSIAIASCILICLEFQFFFFSWNETPSPRRYFQKILRKILKRMHRGPFPSWCLSQSLKRPSSDPGTRVFRETPFQQSSLGETRVTLTALWRVDELVPSSSSPSGSWSSLSVHEDTSSMELVKSGRLLEVNLRRSSAELSCGDARKGPGIIPWHQPVLLTTAAWAKPELPPLGSSWRLLL